MERKEVVNFCAQFWQVDPTFIAPEMKIDDRSLPNNSSIRFYQFLARVEEHFKVRLNNIDGVITFADLFKSLEDSS